MTMKGVRFPAKRFLRGASKPVSTEEFGVAGSYVSICLSYVSICLYYVSICLSYVSICLSYVRFLAKRFLRGASKPVSTWSHPRVLDTPT